MLPDLHMHGSKCISSCWLTGSWWQLVPTEILGTTKCMCYVSTLRLFQSECVRNDETVLLWTLERSTFWLLCLLRHAIGQRICLKQLSCGWRRGGLTTAVLHSVCINQTCRCICTCLFPKWLGESTWWCYCVTSCVDLSNYLPWCFRGCSNLSKSAWTGELIQKRGLNWFLFKGATLEL